MGKENHMGLSLENVIQRQNNSKYWKDKGSKIGQLFETLGHTNIINLMQGVGENLSVCTITRLRSRIIYKISSKHRCESIFLISHYLGYA